LPYCCPAPLACGKRSGEIEHHSGAAESVQLQPGTVFNIIPEWCSESARNTVQLHRGILFSFGRIPHLELRTQKTFGQQPNLAAKPRDAAPATGWFFNQM
jgi:hypothetical protein